MRPDHGTAALSFGDGDAERRLEHAQNPRDDVGHQRLVELGNHAELVAQGGRYAALADAWAKSQPVV